MRLLVSRVVILFTLLFLAGCNLLAPIKPDAFSEAQNSDLPIVELRINSLPLRVEVASTAGAKAQGLSDRISMPQDAGMLFVFDKADKYGFWMNRMNFPLDFIWLEKGLVVEVTENVPNPTTSSPNPVTIIPSVPIDAVIEVNAGWVKDHGVGLGDVVEGLTGW